MQPARLGFHSTLFSGPGLSFIRRANCDGTLLQPLGIPRCGGKPRVRRLVAKRRCLFDGLVVKGLRPGRGFLGCAKLAQPVADFLGLSGRCIELLPPIGCLQLYDLKKVAGPC